MRRYYCPARADGQATSDLNYNKSKKRKAGVFFQKWNSSAPIIRALSDF